MLSPHQSAGRVNQWPYFDIVDLFCQAIFEIYFSDLLVTTAEKLPVLARWGWSGMHGQGGDCSKNGRPDDPGRPLKAMLAMT